MNNKKIKRISRKKLLEIMLSQANRIEELEQELINVKKTLNSKRIIISESGNLATAALKLNGIFELAQKIADEYVYNIKENCKELNTSKKNNYYIEKYIIQKSSKPIQGRKVRDKN